MIKEPKAEKIKIGVVIKGIVKKTKLTNLIKNEKITNLTTIPKKAVTIKGEPS
jgi:hypothetical protein